MNDLAQPTTQLALFDYDQLDQETRIVVQQRTGEIKSLVKKTAEGIIEIGDKLADVRDRLTHNKQGGFEDWLKAEFNWSKSTAYNFINVSERFGNRPNFGELALSSSVLYLLASPSTPDDAIDEALARAQGGEPVTVERAKQIVVEHKQWEEEIAAQSAEAAEEPAVEEEPATGDDGLPVASPTWLTPKTDSTPASTDPGQAEARTNEQLDQLAEAEREWAEVGKPPAKEQATHPEPKPESKPPPPPPPPPKPKPAPPPGDWHIHATIKHTGSVLLTLSQVGNDQMTSLNIRFQNLLEETEQLLNKIPADQIEKLRGQVEEAEA